MKTEKTLETVPSECISKF